MKVIPIRPKLMGRTITVRPPISSFRGCLLGGAVGDALGAPVEAMSREQITARLGKWVDRYITTSRHPRISLGQWTDDTALSLATAESIVEQNGLDVNQVRLSLMTMFNGQPDRGYGQTTRRALDPMSRPAKARPSNGAAMRIHPVGLYHYWSMESLLDSVVEVSRITHQHQDAIDAAVAVAFAVAKAARGELKPAELLEETIAFLPPHSNMGEKLREVEDLLFMQVRTEDGLEQLGTRPLALETVGSAFYAFLRTPDDFYQSLIAAVNAGGDTDTVGSITGAISGCYNGIEKIPSRWLNHLEARGLIDEISQRLFFISA
ncbi:MAG: ADP-ribosylglycohydrolase family protein [Candidatus Saganbacteria bacterium]|nr:ADP-ribosylglycohydrolase family protein [Candidatus Saganbacteria bacterium]